MEAQAVGIFTKKSLLIKVALMVEMAVAVATSFSAATRKCGRCFT